ncbi:3714_t:CDS:1, partial [Gigaspora margarita]
QNKVLAISQIQSDILWSCKIKISKKYDSQVCRLYVVASILSDDEDTEQELVNSDLNYQVNDDGYIKEDKTTRQTNESLKENKYLDKEEQR